MLMFTVLAYDMFVCEDIYRFMKKNIYLLECFAINFRRNLPLLFGNVFCLNYRSFERTLDRG